MDFHASQRLLDSRVLEFLQIVVNQERAGERPPVGAFPALVYLTALSRLMRGYMVGECSPLECICDVWYARFFVEGWLLHVRQQVTAEQRLFKARQRAEKVRPVRDRFSTYNSYRSILLAADSLLLYVVWIIHHPWLRSHVSFAPWMLLSQRNEHLFRDNRQLRQHPNFDLAEFLLRSALNQAHQIIKASGKFQYPAHRKHWSLDELSRPALLVPADVSEASLRRAIEEARAQALSSLRALGALPTLAADEEFAGPEFELEIEPDPSLSDVAASAILEQRVDERAGSDPAADPDLLGVEADLSDLEPTPLMRDDDDDDDDEDEGENSPRLPQLLGSPPTPQPKEVCFAPRDGSLTRTAAASSSKYLVTASGEQVSKPALMAILSGHPKTSKDRLRRVCGM